MAELICGGPSLALPRTFVRRDKRFEKGLRPIPGSSMSPSDQRKALRAQIYRQAQLIIPRLASIYFCGLRDLSSGGAGLRLSGLVLLPISFELFSRDLVARTRCRLIWRHGDFAGVAFDPADRM